MVCGKGGQDYPTEGSRRWFLERAPWCRLSWAPISEVSWAFHCDRLLGPRLPQHGLAHMVLANTVTMWPSLMGQEEELQIQWLKWGLSL